VIIAAKHADPATSLICPGRLTSLGLSLAPVMLHDIQLVIGLIACRCPVCGRYAEFIDDHDADRMLEILRNHSSGVGTVIRLPAAVYNG
jgi:hypothetical protein